MDKPSFSARLQCALTWWACLALTASLTWLGLSLLRG